MTVKERYNAPFQSQDQNEVNELVQAMQAGAGKKGKKGNAGFSCRMSDYPVANSKHVVTSWKFQDWDYKQKRLPTNARGLFTIRNPNGNHEIVTRGYDKFFNTGEVPRTKWEWIKDHTQGPYDVTMKENGCIIFISGLPDGTLLVCSKHSTGDRGDPSKSHSSTGDRWINKQLESIGKTREEFAKFLRDANVTAVAELCDDSFEEHILEYTGDMAGLYLHGVNLNLPVFATWAAAQVRAFADDWGFKKIETIEKNSVDELKTFLEGVAETGEWNGRAVEGFVIRCKARFDGRDDTNWLDWFFKYKFEEPYLMYRGWREVTKQIISGHEPRFKKHVAITNKYIVYAREQLRKNPGLGRAFMQNHGIIAMRDGFLASEGISGHEIIKQEEEAGEGRARSIVLVPIATLGCGKTTVALGLVKLFDCGHVQNDNITVKKGKPAAFAREIAVQLNNHQIVIADRNNHQKREREQLIQDVLAINRDVRFVALNYVHHRAGENLYPKIREVTRKRIFDRGDNHQTIHSGTVEPNTILGIMEGFLERFQPLDADTEPDSRFDNVIELDPLAESRENLETVVGQLHDLYPHLLGEDMPSTGDLDEAVEFALSEYKPDIKHTINNNRGGNNKLRVIGAGPSDAGASSSQNNDGGNKDNENSRNQGKDKGKKEKQPAVEYFSVNVPASMVTASLDQAFSGQPAEIRQLYTQLKSTRRIQPAFHITMAHRANVKRQPELWAHYTTLQKALPAGETKMDDLKVKMEKVVWDNRVMAIKASLVDDKGHGCGNEVMHITVGTAAEGIKPRESNDLLERWEDLQGEGELEGSGIRELALGKDGGGVVVDGVLTAVMAKH
ncbi:hypothetical protein ABW21_db0200360 [Orbilia brochopaga]|nr:hypothetical protein ABW21_db0200360 [Drechslerella brochopaga]